MPPRWGSFYFVCVSPGFHIGLCPHFTLGYAGVPPLQGSLSDCLLFTQGFISGFVLIPPWAMRGCRPCRALCRIGCVSPGFHIGLRPHFTLGFAGVSPLQGSLSYWLRFPRVSYRASPSFHPGLCGGVALAGLFVVLAAFPQGFISGFALISPWAMRGCRPYRALCRIGRLRCCVVVLCSLNVFGCV